MNIMLIMILALMSTINVSRSEKSMCNHGNEHFDTLPNKMFEEISISTVEDLILNLTQMDITVKPQPGYSNSTCLVVLSSNDELCFHYSETSFSLNQTSLTIPNLKNGTLKPGCNYTVTFSGNDYCIVRYYKIPEPKPCQHYLPEDILNTFPNVVIDNLTVTAFKKNAIRLNILLTPKPEYVNFDGIIVISSKMGKCNHPEEFSFNLAENNITVPRGEFPHSFIDSGCEYMIDLEIGGYCITTNYEVPNLCFGKEPHVEITQITEIKKGIYKVNWTPKPTQTKKHYSILDVSYRIDNVSYNIFNNEMVKNQYGLNYSILDLSKLPKSDVYKLTAVFMNEHECSSIAFIKFEVKEDHKVLIIMSAIFIIIVATLSIACTKIPMIRSRIIFIFKKMFGVAIQIPIADIKYVEVKPNENINPDYVSADCDEFEFPRCRLKIQPQSNPPGGAFGVIYFGRAHGIKKDEVYTPVAIKTIRENAPTEAIDALREEIKTMKKITTYGNHENVVKMLGCCTIQKPENLILEWVSCGDLKKYLVELRNEWSTKATKSCFFFPDNSGSYISPPNIRTVSETSSACIPSPTETESTIIYDSSDNTSMMLFDSPPMKKVVPALSNVELQNFALQIAKGMAFLENISVVHRDLAARNVLINEMKVLKISDFGMSRIGDYVHRNTGHQPLRWMAPESIESCMCTSKSDVWSFGVVLWEIGTLGAFPYDSISNDCILEYLLYSLKKGIRLMRPEICTDELYSLMLKCWLENSNERPTFQQIVDHLSGEKKKIYLDFEKLNPAYVFPPTKIT